MKSKQPGNEVSFQFFFFFEGFSIFGEEHTNTPKHQLLVYSRMSDISVYITSDLTSSERRISPQWDLHYLKTKLELITGIVPKDQIIQHYPIASSDEKRIISSNEKYSKEQDEQIRVAQFEIGPYSRLHVIDTNPDSPLRGLEEEQVEGFKLSEEEYAKKSNTVLRWKKDNQLGRFDPQFEAEKQKKLQENLKISENIKVGDRCRVINIQGQRLGTVKYVGEIKQLDSDGNIWVGVEFDEPLGRNDGLIDGTKYFDARHNHGSFLKPKQVEVGDFPEEDPFASDDDEL